MFILQESSAVSANESEGPVKELEHTADALTATRIFSALVWQPRNPPSKFLLRYGFSKLLRLLSRNDSRMIRTALNETEIEREYVKNVSFDENDIGIIETILRVSLDRVI